MPPAGEKSAAGAKTKATKTGPKATAKTVPVVPSATSTGEEAGREGDKPAREQRITRKRAASAFLLRFKLFNVLKCNPPNHVSSLPNPITFRHFGYKM